MRGLDTGIHLCLNEFSVQVLINLKKNIHTLKLLALTGALLVSKIKIGEPEYSMHLLLFAAATVLAARLWKPISILHKQVLTSLKG